MATEPSENFGEAWLTAMRAQDFAAAFAVSDAVLAAHDPATRDDSRLPYHLRWVWDGRPLHGREIMVRCYHGLGDTLQFCRFLPALADRAASVTVEVPAALLGLLRQVQGVDRWIAFDPARPAPPGEADIEIMELAHALRLTPREVPPPALEIDPLTVAEGTAIGLCWRAGEWDAARSVSMMDLLAATIPPGATAISLQRGAAADEAADARFANPGDDDPDLVRTARLIRGTRHVATVDTVVAHLAGTLGHPTWLLLKAEPDWRWHCADWYPTVQQIRQHHAGDWSAALAELTRRVAAD